MGIGKFLLNWGVFTAGIISFGFGQLFFSLCSKEYKRHVLKYGRIVFGKERGTTWNNIDEIRMLLERIFWTLGSLGVPGVLLFFFTGIFSIGIPLWLGCTFGIAGIFLVFFAFNVGMGIARRDVNIAVNSLRNKEQTEPALCKDNPENTDNSN